MSGGAYQYAYWRIMEMQEALIASERDKKYYTARDYHGQEALRRRFCRLLGLVAEACRAIEWNDSGDGDYREAELIRKCLKGGKP